MNNVKWLASVRSLEEAMALSQCLPDIVDMKQPATGALGALATAEVKTIVDWLNGRCLTSATVGDLPMQAHNIASALQSMAETGVDIVKLGLFGGEEQPQCLQQLQPVFSQLKVPVIAVMFADRTTDLSMLATVQTVGFKGIMVDTASKNGQGLLDVWSQDLLAGFVKQAQALNLLCGVAGALRIEDIAPLKRLCPDYLGFRSALCADRQRNHSLQSALAQQIRQALTEPLELTG